MRRCSFRPPLRTLVVHNRSLWIPSSKSFSILHQKTYAANFSGNFIPRQYLTNHTFQQYNKMASSHFSSSPNPSHVTKTEVEDLIKKHKTFFNNLHENKLSESDIASGLPYYLIDVRQAPELEDTGTIDESAIHIPLHLLDRALSVEDEQFKSFFGIPKPKTDAQIIFYCHSGYRSEHASMIAAQKGYTNAKNYKGSAAEWFGLARH